MSAETQYFKIIKESIEGKDKWVLYHMENESYKRIYAFANLRNAKARMFKMTDIDTPYHYSVFDNDEVIEHDTVCSSYPLVFELPPEPVSAEQEQQADKSYKRFVYTVSEIREGIYILSGIEYSSSKKDTFGAVLKDFTVGEYASYSDAMAALRSHAEKLPAYWFYSTSYKSDKANSTVLQNKLVSRFGSHDAQGWFEETVAPAKTASAEDGIAGATVSPPSNTGGLKSDKDKTERLPSIPKMSSSLSTPEFLQGIEAEIQKFTVSESYAHQYFENGVLKTLMLRRGIDSPAFIDTLSFTVSESCFHRLDDNGQWVCGDESVLSAISSVSDAMGLGLVGDTPGKNGYLYGLQFGDKSEKRNFGFVCWGGENQKGSIMFHFTGEGLANASDGWEKNLYLLLSRYSKLSKITRVDISHDFLLGNYTLDKALEDWRNDRFTVRQTKPQAELMGSDWISDTRKGRTFYIGSKKSSRVLYFYEKGKQLGDKDSPWVRLELRQRNKDYIIPFDVLLYPGDYLCTAYPYISEILSYDFSEQYRFQRIKKENGIAVDHVIKYAKMQVSPAIKMLQSLGLDSDDIVEKLLNPKAKLPKRLQIQRKNRKKDD